MKKIILLIFLSIFICLSVNAEEISYVQVKSTALRQEASYTGKILANIGYLGEVVILQKASQWSKVSYKGKTGFINNSAISNTLIKKSSGGSQSQEADNSNEVALAGKGFNENMEKSVKNRSDLNYKAVDELENFKVSDLAFNKFLAESRGNL